VLHFNGMYQSGATSRTVAGPLWEWLKNLATRLTAGGGRSTSWLRLIARKEVTSCCAGLGSVRLRTAARKAPRCRTRLRVGGGNGRGMSPEAPAAATMSSTKISSRSGPGIPQLSAVAPESPKWLTRALSGQLIVRQTAHRHTFLLNCNRQRRHRRGMYHRGATTRTTAASATYGRRLRQRVILQWA